MGHSTRITITEPRTRAHAELPEQETAKTANVPASDANSETPEASITADAAVTEEQTFASYQEFLHSQSDFELIDLTLKGERNAFEILIERYRNSIYALAFRMLRNHEDASDISQDVFFKAYEALATFKKKSSFHTWLYRIATNSCINYLRKYSAQHQIELATYHTAKEADTLDSLYKLELQDVVNTAIEKLPEKQKATVILRVCEGLSHREVSQKLECSVGTAKANYFHAIRNLRRFMKQYIATNMDLSIPGTIPGTTHPYNYA
jgi:RNA polymerase sigma-70 factor (ECF subfamily)